MPDGVRPSAYGPHRMYGRVVGVTVLGVGGHLVTVEAFVGRGLPSLVFTGLPGASVNDARDRVRPAVESAGLEWPLRRVVVNLAPASLRKDGPGTRPARRRRRPCCDRTGARSGRRGVRVRRRAVPQRGVAADTGHPVGGHRRGARRSEGCRGSGRERARSGADRFAADRRRRRRSATSRGSSRARGTLPRSISRRSRPPRRRRSTSPRCEDRRRPVAPSRWRPPVGTTSS